MPKLIAKEKFYYAGRNVEAGEEFEAEIGDVPILTHANSPKAKQPEAQADPPPAAAPSVAVSDDATEANKAPRTTRTRSLKASTSPPTDEPSSGPSRYNRADMRAED